MNADQVTALDAVVAFVLLIATARGGYIGVIRESFSIAMVAVFCIAMRYGNADAASWLSGLTGGEISPGVAPFITGAVILLGTVGLVGLLASTVKRGAAVAGLGWLDRICGAVLGFAEGALVATVLVLGTSLFLGSEHKEIRRSHSVEAVELLERYVATEYPDQFKKLPDVAAPLRR